MASGFDDSAQTLYYSNINYNNGENPKSSYVNTDLESHFLFNQSNYQCSINKIKITSLEGVRIGTLPFNEWQVGLEIADADKVTQYSSAYVALLNEQGVQEYFEYYSVINSNYTVSLYKGIVGNTTIAPASVLTFTPLNSTAQQVFPNYVFYDTTELLYWICDEAKVYLYGSAGQFIQEYALSNIVNAYFSGNAKSLIVCESYGHPTVDNTIYIFASNGYNISTPRTITTNHAGNALTNLRCAATDGTTLIAGYDKVKITVWNFADLQSQNDADLTAQAITNITNILVNTTDDSYVFTDYKYEPELGASTNNTSGSYNYINLYNLTTGAEMVPLSKNFTSFTALTSQAFVFAGSGDLSDPSTWELYYRNTTFNNVNPGDIYLSGGFTGLEPLYVSCFNTPVVDGAFLVGVRYSGAVGSAIQIVSRYDVNVWTSVGTIPTSLYPSGYSALPRLACDLHTSTIYATFGNPTDGYKIIKSSAVPYQFVSAPFLSFTGVSWQQINSNIDVEAMIWDETLKNTCYAVSNGIIYIGYYNNVANKLIFRQYYWNTGTTYHHYITTPNNWTLYQNSTNLNKNKISTSKFIDYLSINDSYANIGLSRIKDIIYLASLSTNKIVTYSYVDLIGGDLIPSLNVYGNIGVQTSYELIPPPTTDTLVYNMEQYVSAFNTALASCYEQLSQKIASIPIPTAPYFTLDYTTHRLTLNYDPKYSTAGNGIFVNTPLLRYTLFPSIASSTHTGMNKFVLSPTGSIIQSKETMYLLNEIDKLIIVTNMALNSDYSGQYQSSVFTDLDFDTQNQFFNMDGNFIYNAILLRKYDMVSNTSLRAINYEIFIQYKDETQEPFLVPPGENVSIKFEFDRIY